MREIKFRAWDTKEKRMSLPFNVKEDWGDYLIDFEDYNADGASKEMEWLQYTGLKDKNGTEIYEGDILKLDGRHRTPQGVYIDVSGVMEWEENRNGWTQFSPIERFEVIGNIYENKELLNENS